jgi:two-component system chemotaxis response regulator CheB
LDLVEELDPDVVVLDLIMPQMDGVEFLQKQMARRPIAVIVVSVESESGEMALAALDAGAIDFIQKPTALATEKIYEISDELIAKVKSAANASLTSLRSIPTREIPVVRTGPTVTPSGRIGIVVIGISTGGPQALKFLIPQFPADFPLPIATVLHMPVGYTQMYAQRLNEVSNLEVVEAREGDIVRPGVMLLAPAGRHLSFRRTSSGTVVAHLDARPFDTPHRPSVDVLFQSAAEVYRERVLGVVMTGMGSDGKQGAAWIKSQGGMVFIESEETCVVYGMPRSVLEAGLSDRVVTLDRMVQAIMETI